MLRFAAFAVVQPLIDLSMLLSCGLLLGRWGEFFPHIYEMEEYVHSREALERLIESFLEAVFQSVVFYLGGSYIFQVSQLQRGVAGVRWGGKG